MFLLGRIPASIVSVTEKWYLTDVVLDASDYVVHRGTFRRLDTGLHPRGWTNLDRFGYNPDRITIVYVPADDASVRLIATVGLVALDVLEKDAGAVVSRTVGLHAVTYAKPAERQEARAAIWADLEAPQTPLFA